MLYSTFFESFDNSRADYDILDCLVYFCTKILCEKIVCLQCVGSRRQVMKELTRTRRVGYDGFTQLPTFKVFGGI